jgi:hypothetical protein
LFETNQYFALIAVLKALVLSPTICADNYQALVLILVPFNHDANAYARSLPLIPFPSY